MRDVIFAVGMLQQAALIARIDQNIRARQPSTHIENNINTHNKLLNEREDIVISTIIYTLKWRFQCLQ